MSGYDTKLLIIEDEGLIGMALSEEVRALKFDPVGPFTSLEEGLNALVTQTFDLALVDINLRGEMSYPLIDALLAANVPTAVMTAYSDHVVPERYSDLPKLDKPFSSSTLCDVLLDLVRAQRVKPQSAGTSPGGDLSWPCRLGRSPRITTCRTPQASRS